MGGEHDKVVCGGLKTHDIDTLPWEAVRESDFTKNYNRAFETATVRENPAFVFIFIF